MDSKSRQVFTDHLLFTFMIMGASWGLCLILGINGITKADHAWVNIPNIIGGLSTTIASFIALRKTGEVKGFKDWIKHVFDFKHSLWCYLMAVLIPVIHAVLNCLIGGYELVQPLYMILPMIPVMIIGGGLEEAGWRYITFPVLDKKFGFVLSALITGIIWALWHLPLFFTPGVSQYGQSFLLFSINVMGLSFCLAAIRKVTNSVWLCVLCHSIVNAIPEAARYDFCSKKQVIIAPIVIIISIGCVMISRKIKLNNDI